MLAAHVLKYAVQATYYSQPNSPTTFACASNNKAPTTTLPSVALAAGGAFGWQSDFSACNMCLQMRGTGSGIGNSPVTTSECTPPCCVHAHQTQLLHGTAWLCRAGPLEKRHCTR